MRGGGIGWCGGGKREIYRGLSKGHIKIGMWQRASDPQF